MGPGIALVVSGSLLGLVIVVSGSLLGLVIVVSGSLLGLVIVFDAWRRLPPVVAFALMAGCGALVGAGALLVQDGASWLEWALTIGVLGVFSPVHARLVFGRPGPAA